MLRRNVPILVAAAILAGVVAAPAAGRAAGISGDRAVIVELFTSQGCSSCPPADRLLSRLGDRGLGGIEVIPLAFHVDYWNYIGWTDPFSSADWSKRQASYARAFAARGVYTPQVVIGGVSEHVGSEEREVAAAIRAAAARPVTARLVVTLGEGGAASGGALAEPDQGGSGARARSAGVHVRLAADLARAERVPIDAWVAVVEDGLVTPVGRGENSGHTLRNDAVVRRLERAATLEATGPADAALEIAIDPAWKRANLSIVAFLQERETMAVLAAARARLEQPEGVSLAAPDNRPGGA